MEPGLTPVSHHQDYSSVPLPLPILPSQGSCTIWAEVETHMHPGSHLREQR